jgi:hypothetical protein
VGEFRKEAFIPLFKSSFIGFETVLDNNDFSRLTDYLITWGQISNWLSDETKNDSLLLFLGEKSGVLPITKLQNFQERTLKQLGIDLNEIEDNKKQLFISYLVASVAAHTLYLLNQSSINPNPNFVANLQQQVQNFFNSF